MQSPLSYHEINIDIMSIFLPIYKNIELNLNPIPHVLLKTYDIQQPALRCFDSKRRDTVGDLCFEPLGYSPATIHIE